MIVYKFDLKTDIPIIETKVPVTIKQLSSKDFERGIHYKMIQRGIFYSVIRNISKKRFKIMCQKKADDIIERYRAKKVCFYALNDNEVAGYIWIYFTKNYESDIEREELFYDDEALMNSLFVFPEFRKRNIARKLYESSLDYLQKNGYNRAFGYVDDYNIPSKKILESMGFIPIKLILFIRIFSYRKLREKILI